jgi:hypothetical protein
MKIRARCLRVGCGRDCEDCCLQNRRKCWPSGEDFGDVGGLRQFLCAYLCSRFCKLLLLQRLIIGSSPSAAAISLL